MMYGIEYEEFPARIAEVAMWLIDHQMNQIIGLEFGQNIALIPLKQSANILHTNALTTDWETLVPKTELNYILGNPPFVGSKVMSAVQRAEVVKEFNGKPGSGVLDYVSAWYAKAAKYIRNTNIEAAFVSTNSIVQGEQTSILWGELLEKYHIKINFAHRTFKWTNEAKGKAAVYCIIVGFSTQDRKDKRIFVYEDIKGEPHEIKAKNINPYLVDAANVLIGKRTKPISKVPPMSFGNMPLDGGHLLLSAEEKDEFLQKEPEAEKFVLPLISAHEFLNGKTRYCLWLVDAEPLELKKLPEVLKRIEEVRKFRLNSVAPSTQKFAATPSTFRDKNRPETFIVIPRVSSENRKYIPMGFFDANSIVSDTCLSIPNGELYHFGILMSAMHMSWVSNVCGRLESRYRYSKDIVYNNFPWPVNPSSKQLANIAKAAQEVLDAREKFPQSSLADLYDPLTMPHVLLKAHQNMDKAVDAAYSSKNFKTETDRMEFLFGLYGELVK